MYLTAEEFAKIRPIEWVAKDIGGRLVNTPTNQTFTQLFWMDFVRYVFAPKFKRQSGVTSIASFDPTSPVLLSDELELQLPTPMETAMYYTDNAIGAPMKFAFPFSQLTALLVALLVLFAILLASLFVTPSTSSFYRLI